MRVRANASSAASRAAEASRARNAASADQRPDSIGEPGHVARLVRERGDAWIDQLRRAAPGARHHCAAAGHRFGDHQAERLRLRAGVHHHVERAHRGGGVEDVADEADAAGEALLARQRLQLVERDLAGAGGVDGAANDVAAHAERLGQEAQRAQERRMSLPAREGRHQAHPRHAARRRRQARQPIEVQGRARRVNSVQGPRRSTRGRCGPAAPARARDRARRCRSWRRPPRTSRP